MSNISARTVVNTPTGFRIPLFLYAVWIAVAITAGSAIGMYKFHYPWWVWVIEAAVLIFITYGISRKMVSTNQSGDYVIVGKSKAITFAIISAVLIALLVIMSTTM